MWQGDKLKEQITSLGFSQAMLAKELDVSKTAVGAWIKGSMPKGQHLIKMCNILRVNPDFFFSEGLQGISIPVHRKKLAGKITDDSRDISLKMATTYLNLFRNSKPPALDCVIRNITNNDDEQISLAHEMRSRSGIQDSSPITYDHVFILLHELKVIPIFRLFPNSLKAYAFQTNINDHRVIFVDTKTNIIDLTFVLLHEAVHSLIYKGPESVSSHYGDQEEDFCDNVSGYIQFPPQYIEEIIRSLKGKSQSEKVMALKYYSRMNKHATFGISKRIRSQSKVLDNINPSAIAGTDTNIRKTQKTLGDILFSSDNPADYIQTTNKFSPLFITLLKSQIDITSVSKISEWLDLDNISDAKQAISELRRI